MRKTKNKVFVGLFFLLTATFVVWQGQAQSQEAYPTRPIEVIVGFSPGGSTDLLCRTITAALSKKWGVPVNVVNKPGGNAVPAFLAGHQAKPDGYTMLMDANSTSSMLGVAVKDLPFGVMDRTYIARIGYVPQIFVVAANSSYKSLKEVGEVAKKDPDKFTWTMNGDGSDTTGLSLRQFFAEFDVDLSKTKAVSAAGGAQGIVLVAGGNVIFGSPTVTTAVSSLNAGTLKGLAITAPKRMANYPAIPTTAELGYPGIDIMWRGGMSGPPNLPASIVAKWEKALEELTKDPEVVAQMGKLGITADFHNSKETREIVRKESDQVTKLWAMWR